MQEWGRTIFLILVLTVAAAVAPWPGAGNASTPQPNGDWTGTYVLPGGTTPVQIDTQLRGSTAFVALGPGHASLQSVPLKRHGSTISFSIPGAPAPVNFDLHLQRRVLTGSVKQGRVTGKVRLSAGKATLARFLGSYRTASGDTLIVIDLSRLSIPPQVIDVGTDGFRALYSRNETAFVIGSGNETRKPVAGNIQFSRDGSALNESLAGAAPVRAIRISYHEEEVRYRSGSATIAATLVLPRGTGPFPAAMMVHGSGGSFRDEGQAFSSFLAARGIASLKIDKRGIGESGGVFPGEGAGAQSVATYASDTVAGGRFLAAQPNIDHKKIGLFGGSQAGWIIPKAAADSGSLFSYAVILSGPVVSVGETAYYSLLTTQGAVTPQMTPDQIDAAVLQGRPSGVDPRPWLRKLRIPMFWVYGGLDQHQPTRLDVTALEGLKASTGADFSWVVFPKANHGLVDTKTGLNSEAATAPGFSHGLFASMANWLHDHSIGI
jgi:uncharacterized protein